MKVVLEFEAIKLDRIKKRWKLFFLIVVNDPENQDNKLVTVVPHMPIKLYPKDRNVYYFGNEDGDNHNGEESDTGMFVLKMPLPEDRISSVSVYLFHSRESIRNAGEILEKLGGFGDEQVDTVAEIVTATALPWVKLGLATAGKLGSMLEELSDRYFGFASLDEQFTPKYDSGGERDCYRTIGKETLEYSWRIIPD